MLCGLEVLSAPKNTDAGYCGGGSPLAAPDLQPERTQAQGEEWPGTTIIVIIIIIITVVIIVIVIVVLTVSVIIISIFIIIDLRLEFVGPV